MIVLNQDGRVVCVDVIGHQRSEALAKITKTPQLVQLSFTFVTA